MDVKPLARYDRLSQLLHTVIMLLILGMLVLGNVMNTPALYALHKSIGLLLLVLIAVWIIWRLTHPAPPLPEAMPRWQVVLAKWHHVLFYLALLLMPIAGLLMAVASNHAPAFFGLFIVNIPSLAGNMALAKLAHDAHGFLAWVLIVLIAVHILAVIKHQVFEKNGILKRMF